MSTESLTVAPGTRLLHIGPHKTGTSALQAAFHAARSREQLAQHGVVYPGPEQQPRHAACAVTGARITKGAGKPKLRHWRALRAEVARAGDDQRVVISSEYFSNADDDAARTVVEGLGSERVHVVITLRPLLKILPSQWQEFVKGGLRLSYENWLRRKFQTPAPGGAAPGLGVRHRHDQLVERWAKIVGPGNLTVVVVDDSDRQRLLRVFEELAGLPEGLLDPGETANQSLTYTEAELLRTLNRKLRAYELDPDEQIALVRNHITRQLVQNGGTGRGDPIPTPAWAVTAALEHAERTSGAVAALGVRVVGDLGALTKPPAGSLEDAPAAPRTVPMSLAAEAAAGGILAAYENRRGTTGRALLTAARLRRRVSEMSGRELFRTLGRRARQRFRPRGRPRPAASSRR